MRKTAFWTVIVLYLVSGCAHLRADEALFRESVTAGKAADAEVRWDIFNEIARAQMKSAYYREALETIGLIDMFADQSYLELAAIRANQGDVQGAKDMAAGWAPDLKRRAYEQIAVAQGAAGDFKGARETSRDLPDKSNVLNAIGNRQVEMGDIEGALATASGMKPAWGDEVLLAVVDKLREQGHQQQADQIARRITVPELRKPSRRASNKQTAATPAAPEDTCKLLWKVAKSGKDVDVYNARRCDCSTAGAVRAEAGDADGAERVMRGCRYGYDFASDMAGLTIQAATRGDVSTALKLADSVHVTNATYEGYLAPALRDIGRAWAKKDATGALKWARSRPDGYQRAMAVLGVAESTSPTKQDSPK